MCSRLLLELITYGKGLPSNLAPLLHENSKVWPRQGRAYPVVHERSLRAHELLAQEAPGTILADDSQRESLFWPSVPEQSLPHSNPLEIVSLNAVGRILTGWNSSMLWHEDISGSELRLSTYVLAWRVRGLSPGSYFYRQTGQKLIFVRHVLDGQSQAKIVSDHSVLCGSVVLMVACGMVRYDGEGGERHYREILIAAGAMLNSLGHRVRELGFVAAILTKFFDDPLALELGLNPMFEQPLAALAFGTSE